jgi:hypothetical protein
MADIEMIAATLAASVTPRADFYQERDLRSSVERSARFAVNVYEAILAELVKREGSGSTPTS